MSAAVFIKNGVRTILSVTNTNAHTERMVWFLWGLPKIPCQWWCWWWWSKPLSFCHTVVLVGNKKNYRWKSDNNNNNDISLNCHLIGGSITPALDLSWKTPIPNRLCLRARVSFWNIVSCIRFKMFMAKQTTPFCLKKVCTLFLS